MTSEFLEAIFDNCQVVEVQVLLVEFMPRKKEIHFIIIQLLVGSEAFMAAKIYKINWLKIARRFRDHPFSHNKGLHI
jgi:hypothetical protein